MCKMPREIMDGRRPPNSAIIFATAGYDHTIKFWNVTNTNCMKTLQHTESQVNALAISSDRLLLAAASYQHIRMYDVNATNQSNPVVNYEGVTKNVTAVGFHQEMNWMYTGGEDFSARIWDLRSRNLQCQRIFQVNTPVNCVCLHPNQAELFIGDQSGTIHLWDLRNDRNEQLLPEPDASISHLDVDPDGTMLAAINNKGVCYTWNLIAPAAPEQLTRLNPKIKKEAHQRYGLKCRFSPDSTLLATTSADQTCRIWRTTDFGQCSTLKTNGQRWVWDCAFTADSQYVFTCSSDNCARLWRAESTADGALNGAEPLREYAGHQRAVTALALADCAAT